MTEDRLLAVHVGDVVPEVLPRVLAAPGPRWTPVAADPGHIAVDSVQGHLFVRDVLPRRPPAASAVWLTPDAPDPEPVAGVLRVVELPRRPGAAVLADLTADDVGVATSPLPADARPVLPFARSRYRELRGLPASMTAVVDGRQLTAEWGPDAASTREHRTPVTGVPTLLALAASAVVTGPTVQAALAWACPVVTDPRTAQEWGLTAGVHVLVNADPRARRELAGRLAADPAAAAVLGHAGWTAVTGRTVPTAARALAGRLGFPVGRPGPAANGLVTAMDALGTPSTAFIRRRVREHLAALPGARTSARLPSTEETQ